jgi:hypothetical protein
VLIAAGKIDANAVVHLPWFTIIANKFWQILPLGFLELALVFVRLDHVARIIVSADHGIM